MPTAGAIGWEELTVEDGRPDAWVCADCLAPAEAAEIEQATAELMELDEGVSSLDNDDRPSP